MLIASISTLAETKDEASLKALAMAMDLDVKAMVHNFGHYAVAKFMFSGESLPIHLIACTRTPRI